ncbi:hypothetical protein ICA16_23295 [Pseudomonas anatoliensis]|uniref:hypothetical protein n=1 Tax=Pseudomonas anatoliensis TaxID=2710589 RepID=UPI001B319A49|nr:hypothetical protein [Pseudomonas anatoliensis]MBP5958604.1 hypothetical protein [Pseudomonas anatoliensis]
MNAIHCGSWLASDWIDAVLAGEADAAIAGKPAPTGSVDVGKVRDECDPLWELACQRLGSTRFWMVKQLPPSLAGQLPQGTAVFCN